MSSEDYSQQKSSSNDGWTVQVGKKNKYQNQKSWNQSSSYENEGTQDASKSSYNNNSEQNFENEEDNNGGNENYSNSEQSSNFQNRRGGLARPPRSVQSGVSPTSPGSGYVYQPYVLPSSQFKDKGANQLTRPYTFWFVDKNQASEEMQAKQQQEESAKSAEGEGDEKSKKEKNISIANYEDYLKKIGDFSSIEGFWGFYSHIKRAYDLPNGIDFQMFRKGVNPMWEDKANVRGGKWILRLKKEYTARIWEDLLLAIIGEEFGENSNDICGVVLSLRDSDIISLWVRSNYNKKIKDSLKEKIISVLRLPKDTFLEFRAHSAYDTKAYGAPKTYPPRSSNNADSQEQVSAQ